MRRVSGSLIHSAEFEEVAVARPNEFLRGSDSPFGRWRVSRLPAAGRRVARIVEARQL
jgi:hypothetical protein